MNRLFARIDQGIVMEIVPPLPLSAGWIEIMPEDGDVRGLYGFPPEAWVEITAMEPMPHANWIYTDDGFAPPPLP
ncbi:hypothetical protein DBR45_36655, partial [Pseudomonas sp. HMWF031]